MSCNFEGFKNHKGKLEDLRKNIPILMAELTLEEAKYTKERIQELTPVRTGKLHDSWKRGSVVTVIGDTYSVEVSNDATSKHKNSYFDAVYASYVEEGHDMRKRSTGKPWFVPGIWSGNDFIYIQGHPTGSLMGSRTPRVEKVEMMKRGAELAESTRGERVGKRVDAILKEWLDG